MAPTLPNPPVPVTIPSPEDCLRERTAGANECGEGNITGAVVWHREELRVHDQGAVTAATNAADVVLPLFIFDPGFYGGDGLACDSRIQFLHECLRDLSGQYQTRTQDESDADDGGHLTYAFGDPIPILDAFTDAGWKVFAAQTPTGRYGLSRDRQASNIGVRFVSGDGLRRGVDRTRHKWGDHLKSWFQNDRYTPSFDTAVITGLTTGVTIDQVEQEYQMSPTKSHLPRGGRDVAREKLEKFVGDIQAYPSNISSPLDARDGCSGLSPYIRFGCVSTREVYQYVCQHAQSGRGVEMFRSRLFWNRHYNQKLEDWPGWLDTAVNPVLEEFNADQHDPALVTAWKQGNTGYPMVDAAMRCLRNTGWLNFRMRAMGVSAYFHLLQQPWWIGADWYHHHLIDSDAAINYTQWQSQCGLIGKPGIRLYNPRKQVRDQDPDGKWIRKWVPELEALPAEYLPAPEKTPLSVQRESGVMIGSEPRADYPRPVVEYETAKEQFWRRYESLKEEAAAKLGEEEIARRASLSGGITGAKEIAREYGESHSTSTQVGLADF